MRDIREALEISKSFILNMDEIDYDRLIEFIQDMKSKNESLIEIRVKRGSSKGKWVGHSVSKDGNNTYNITNLSK